MARLGEVVAGVAVVVGIVAVAEVWDRSGHRNSLPYFAAAEGMCGDLVPSHWGQSYGHPVGYRRETPCDHHAAAANGVTGCSNDH